MRAAGQGMRETGLHRVVCRSVVCLVLVAGLSGCRLNSPDRSQLDAWGIPPDLPTKLPQLHSLSLPAEVDSVDWIPPTVRALELSSTGVWDLEGLPDTIVTLHAAYAPVRRVDRLPSSLRELDLRWTEVKQLPAMRRPPWNALRSLAVGGGGFQEPDRWPESLETLQLVGISLRNLRSLPRGLQALHLRGRGIRNLGGIPEGVRILSLENTAAVSLEGLPERLTTLRLEHNSTLRIDVLPRFLERLDLIELASAVQNLSLPPFLHSLSIEGFEHPPEPGKLPVLPDRLETLALKGVSAASLKGMELPPTLRRLDVAGFGGPTLAVDLTGLTDLVLAGSQLEEWPRFPETLESLDVSGILLSTAPEPICVQRSPCELRHLKAQRIGFDPSPLLVDGLLSLDLSGVESIPALKTLPRSLKRLTLDATKIRNLRDLPPNLEFLSIADVPVRTLDDLADLRSLKGLAVAAGQLKSIEGLPPSVEVLIFK